MNTQPIEKIFDSSGHVLDVIDIWKTIQGEGYYTGRVSTFVRFAGCTLDCPLCDTNYTEGRHERSIEWVVNQILGHKTHHVILTGGEPFRQNIYPLVQRLFRAGKVVSVETNGATWYPIEVDWQYQIAEHIHVCCSPKAGRLHPSLVPFINSYKYVLDHKYVDPDDGLPTSILGKVAKPARPMQWVRKDQIWVQPLDAGNPEENKRNQDETVLSCLRHGYNVGLQLHKHLGLD